MLRILVLFCFVWMGTVVAALGGETYAGHVKEARGAVEVVRAGKPLPVQEGFGVSEGDMIRTGEDGAVGIIFRDDTILSLGPESELSVERYLFSPREGHLAMIARMVRGTASYLSGTIGKLSPESVRFETPTATLGVRGTRFLVKVD